MQVEQYEIQLLPLNLKNHFSIHTLIHLTSSLSAFAILHQNYILRIIPPLRFTVQLDIEQE